MQSNTDGITFRVKRSDSDKVDELVKDWEDVTKLEMERVDYSKMYIQNVNNYVAIYENSDKVKAKGAYEVSNEHHKNQSMKVVQKAVLAYLTKGISPEEFVKNHEEMHDFMLRTKIPKSFKLVSVDEHENESKEQNICRYYLSTSEKAKTLIKVMPPLKGKTEDRRNNINVGRKAIVCNNLNNFIGEIDYDFYIQECEKLIENFK